MWRILALSIGAVLACDAGATPGVDCPASTMETIGYTVELESTEDPGGAGGSSFVSFCTVVNSFHGGAGVYRVERIVGATEESDGYPAAFTYVTLELVEEWLPDAPAHPTIRVSGGPIGPCMWQGSVVSLHVGQVAGFLLWEPRPENAGYPSVAPSALFVDHGGHYDSVASFKTSHCEMSLDDIGALVRAEAGKPLASCPQVTEEDLHPDCGARGGREP